MAYQIKVNGKVRKIDAPGEMPLLWALRNDFGLVGTKFGCGVGACGACTVHLDGAPVRACLTPIETVGDSAVTTIEALGETDVGRRLQQAWLDKDVMQCGYCQAGQLMSAAALLKETPKPNEEEIDSAMSGNICRCACYTRIRTAIVQAANMTGKEAANA